MLVSELPDSTFDMIAHVIVEVLHTVFTAIGLLCKTL